MPDALLALSPVDGRYAKNTERLTSFLSEFALIRYRVRIEVEYFLALTRIPLPQLREFPADKAAELQDIYLDFSEADGARVKQLERSTNHDVKAVEYFIKERMDDLGLGAWKEFMHFGLTSQDVNNTSVPLSIMEMMEAEYLPLLGEVVVSLNEASDRWADIPLLARTHGQPASPTRLGKEIEVFAERLDHQLRLLRHIPHSAKFGGATGNMNAHYVAYPDIDWHAFAAEFVGGSLGLHRSFPTTQIEHYDHIAALCHCVMRINTAHRPLQGSVVLYQHRVLPSGDQANEVGSSAIRKVNPSTLKQRATSVWPMHCWPFCRQAAHIAPAKGSSDSMVCATSVCRSDTASSLFSH